MVSRAKDNAPTLALLVHPNMACLSALQRSFETRGVHSVVSRDMPTALLALSQHDFDVAVVHQKLVEEGDGWALGGVVRRLFPQAYIAVTCGEKDVAALQSAINNRLNQVFDEKTASDHIADAVLGKVSASATSQVH